MAMKARSATTDYQRPDRQNRLVQFQASPQIRAALFFLAEREGMDASTYLRRLVLKQAEGLEIPSEYMTRAIRRGPRPVGEYGHPAQG